MVKGSDAWINDPDEHLGLIEVVDEDFETIGWLPRYQLGFLRLPIRIIENTEKYLDDPYILYHARLLYETGKLRGDDLNEVQQALLATNLANKARTDEKLRVRAFEEMLFASNPELFKIYMDQKAALEQVDLDEQIEERIPESVEEFMNLLRQMADEQQEPDGEAQRAQGWLADLLGDDLSQMAEE